MGRALVSPALAGLHCKTHVCIRPYGTPFVTKLKIAYGLHVSKLRLEKKSEKKRRKNYFLALVVAQPYP